MSAVQVVKESLPVFMAGNGTVGTSPAQLSTIAFPIIKHVVVQAASGNGNTVTVGPSSAQATNGYILAAGESTPPIYVDDTSKVWVVGGAAGQDYNWIAN